MQPSGERLFTPQQLAPFDGRGGRRIYLAILGSVYDVTPGAKHYGGSLPQAGWAAPPVHLGLQARRRLS